MTKKIAAILFAALLLVMSCSALADETFNLKLGHNLAEDHAVHISLTAFAADVAAKSNGTINIQIFPNGTLGSESDMISQVQFGMLDMAKVSASTLGNYNKLYNAYSVPYVFDNQEHYYSVMDGEIANELYMATEGDGFIGLTWLDSGSRSFYTKDRAIRTPADLKGLKIRMPGLGGEGFLAFGEAYHRGDGVEKVQKGGGILFALGLGKAAAGKDQCQTQPKDQNSLHCSMALAIRAWKPPMAMVTEVFRSASVGLVPSSTAMPWIWDSVLPVT